MEKNISCDAHDYFEIVCVRHSLIRVTTKNNGKYHGIATDIKLVKKQEYLQINEGINIHQVLLSDVKQLEALGNNVTQHNFTYQIS
jgi:Rho-binding antiterminator